MYRTNFYSKGAFPCVNAFTRPLGPSAHDRSLLLGKDGFTQKQSSFAISLHQEIMTLNKRSDDLNIKMKASKFAELQAEEQKALIREYSMIQRSREMLALIVDQMQKCAANIIANFR